MVYLVRGEPPSHKTFDGEYGVLRIGYCLTLGDLADKPLTLFGKSNNGGGGTGSLLVRYYYGLTALYHGNDRVRRTEVDSYSLSHVLASLSITLGKIIFRSATAQDCWGLVDTETIEARRTLSRYIYPLRISSTTVCSSISSRST